MKYEARTDIFYLCDESSKSSSTMGSPAIHVTYQNTSSFTKQKNPLVSSVMLSLLFRMIILSNTLYNIEITYS